MYQARQKHITGWRAGWLGNRIPLKLGSNTATKPGRRLAGAELDRAKTRLLEQYRAQPTAK